MITGQPNQYSMEPSDEEPDQELTFFDFPRYMTWGSHIADKVPSLPYGEVMDTQSEKGVAKLTAQIVSLPTAHARSHVLLLTRGRRGDGASLS